MWQKVLKVFVDGLIGAIRAWWDREKLIEAEWLAKTKEGQLESFKSTLKLEAKLEEAMAAAGEEVISPADWNEGEI